MMDPRRMQELIEHLDVLIETSRQVIARSAATLRDDLLPVLVDAPTAVPGMAPLKLGSPGPADEAGN
jgi:hypothetical protein